MPSEAIDHARDSSQGCSPKAAAQPKGAKGQAKAHSPHSRAFVRHRLVPGCGALGATNSPNGKGAIASLRAAACSMSKRSMSRALNQNSNDQPLSGKSAPASNSLTADALRAQPKTSPLADLQTVLTPNGSQRLNDRDLFADFVDISNSSRDARSRHVSHDSPSTGMGDAQPWGGSIRSWVARINFAAHAIPYVPDFSIATPKSAFSARRALRASPDLQNPRISSNISHIPHSNLHVHQPARPHAQTNHSSRRAALRRLHHERAFSGRN
jgi:hypothetical protein